MCTHRCIHANVYTQMYIHNCTNTNVDTQIHTYKCNAISKYSYPGVVGPTKKSKQVLEFWPFIIYMHVSLIISLASSGGVHVF